MTGRLGIVASLLFFFGFVAVWLLLNPGVLPGLTAQPRLTGLAIALVIALPIWFFAFVVRIEPGIRRTVGRAFGVRIEIERVSTFQGRSTFQAHDPDGKKSGAVRDLASGLVMVSVWFIATLVLPVATALIAYALIAGVRPSEMFAR